MRLGVATLLLVLLTIGATCPLAAAGQEADGIAVSAGPKPEWRDLFDHLAGTWSLTGSVMGRVAHHTVRAEWVLNHQFLRIEEQTSAGAPADERRYDSIWFLGYDEISERYVMHLMDTFGGRFSETLGYGTPDGNIVRFVFEYPDGPFHTDFAWDPKKQEWNWLMQQKDKSGQWTIFATLLLKKEQ
jgi:hypothetical protein